MVLKTNKKSVGNNDQCCTSFKLHWLTCFLFCFVLIWFVLFCFVFCFSWKLEGRRNYFFYMLRGIFWNFKFGLKFSSPFQSQAEGGEGGEVCFYKFIDFWNVIILCILYCKQNVYLVNTKSIKIACIKDFDRCLCHDEILNLNVNSNNFVISRVPEISSFFVQVGLN